VASVAAPRLAADGTWAAVDAVLRDPPDSGAAEITVAQLRGVVHAVPGADAVVGGVTAITIDTNSAVTRDNWVVIPLILGVVLVVLFGLLRALIAPVLLIASVIVSFLGSMGAAALVFAAMGRSAVYRDLLLYGFLFLVALGVDYTIFLMSRAREETARVGHRAGTSHALAVTGSVITSAGILLAATFSVLAIMPLTFILQMGLLVAIGVLLDTMVVRTMLVPALALDVGPRIWWPSRLARRP
jgi:RND superfamily putative drug exporter